MHGGSPFYHFESKNALLYVVMQEGMAQASAAPAGWRSMACRPDASPRERLRALIRNHFEVLLGADSDFIPVMLYEWRSLNDAAARGICPTDGRLRGAVDARAAARCTRPAPSRPIRARRGCSSLAH